MKGFVLFPVKLLKMFNRVLLNKATGAWMSLPFSQLKDSIAMLQYWYCYNPKPKLVTKRVKYFHINLCKYYLVVPVLVRSRMYSTVCYHIWLISKYQVYSGQQWCRMWVGSLIIWCSPWKEAIDSSRVPSISSTLPDHQKIAHTTGRSLIGITCY